MKPTGIVLLIAGVIALIAAVLVPTVVVPNMVSSELRSTDSTTYGDITGQILNTDRLLSAPNDPYEAITAKSTRVTKADAAAMAEPAAQEAGATVFTTTNVVTRTDNNQELIASAATYAFNEDNSELINCCGASVNGNSDVEFAGIMPLKFPFNVPQADLQVFDPTLLAPVPTIYQGTEQAYGLELYKFSQDIAVVQVPGEPYIKLPLNQAKLLVSVIAPNISPAVDALPVDQEVGLYQFYTAKNTFLVEPVTGEIVDGTINSTFTLRLNGGDTDIVKVLQTEAKSANVEENAETVKGQVELLTTGTFLVPIMLGVLGLVLAIMGIVLIAIGRKRTKVVPAHAASEAKVGVAAGAASSDSATQAESTGSDASTGNDSQTSDESPASDDDTQPKSEK